MRTIEQGKITRNEIALFVYRFEQECKCGTSIDWICYAMKLSRSTIEKHVKIMRSDGRLKMTKHLSHEIYGGTGNGFMWLYTVTEREARAVMEAMK